MFNLIEEKSAIYCTYILAVLAFQKVIHPNIEHSIARPSFGNLYKFQGLLHHSFERYYFLTAAH